jgi:hypothetical protein
VLRGKFIALNAYIKNTERSQVNDLMLHPKLLENKEQTKLKTRRRREIKIRAKINEIETKNPYKESKLHTMKQKGGSLKSEPDENEEGKKQKLIKLDTKKWMSKQTPMKSRGSLGNISKGYMQINWKL